jgi:quercetin dioxygenase-like cupin family protein
MTLEELLRANPIAPDENIIATPLRRGSSSSLHLVQIRDREQPHVHARYDLTVTLLRGKGILHLGEQGLPMRAGDVAFIPRGAPHFFVNEGNQPAVAVVSFAPAFDAPDQKPP